MKRISASLYAVTEYSIPQILHLWLFSPSIIQLEKYLKDLQCDNENGGQQSHRPHPNGPSDKQMRRRTCTLGMWCCGLICGCSPGELPHSSRAGEGGSAVQVAHTNDVDLSLEMTATPSTSQVTDAPVSTVQYQ